MKKKYTFEVEQCVYPADGTYKPGQIYYSAKYQYKNGGFCGGYDTRAEAEQRLYDYQEKNNIPDKDIEWIGIKPKQKPMQMELF